MKKKFDEKNFFIYYNTFLFLLDKKLKFYICIKFFYFLYGFKNKLFDYIEFFLFSVWLQVKGI